MSPSADLDRLRRWQDAGGTWQVLDHGRDGAVVCLLRCDGGEEADRFVSAAPDLLALLAGRPSGAQ